MCAKCGPILETVTNISSSLAVSFIILSCSIGSTFCHCMYGCMFCVLLFNVVSYVFFNCYVYVFLLLCVFCSVYSVSLCRSVYCLCVNVYCTTATGCQHNCS